jgi:hypothetical protein
VAIQTGLKTLATLLPLLSNLLQLAMLGHVDYPLSAMRTLTYFWFFDLVAQESQ